MSVAIRMARCGSKGKPFYKIVAADSEKPRDGRFLEKLGTYNPRADHDGISESPRSHSRDSARSLAIHRRSGLS